MFEISLCPLRAVLNEFCDIEFTVLESCLRHPSIITMSSGAICRTRSTNTPSRQAVFCPSLLMKSLTYLDDILASGQNLHTQLLTKLLLNRQHAIPGTKILKVAIAIIVAKSSNLKCFMRASQISWLTSATIRTSPHPLRKDGLLSTTAFPLKNGSSLLQYRPLWM